MGTPIAYIVLAGFQGFPFYSQEFGILGICRFPLDIGNDNNVSLLLYTTKDCLQTVKGVYDTINSDLNDSYFLVNIDGKRKYLHKSIAIWYLTDEKHKLS